MAGWLERLGAAARKSERTVVGMISGTSADSIDAAVCRIDGGAGSERVALVHYAEHAYDTATQARVLDPAGLDVRGVAELHVAIGEAFARALLETVRAAGLETRDVDLVGSHGQTVYHHSSTTGATRCTLQLGDGDVIAERTGLPVVSDFRARDIAAGGEGAPLTPRSDLVLFAPHADSVGRRRAVLNLGGIANVTVLDPDPWRVFGFDVGPANAPLDRLARRISGGSLAYDRDGAIARAGRVDQSLLERWLASDPYLRRPPPKSTGFEMYGDAFVDAAVHRHGAADADLMATFVEFVAASIADALRRFASVEPPIDELVLAGGGARNPALVDRIAARVAPIRVRRSDELGVAADAREAMGFAVLADLTLRGLPAGLPSVTGARRPAPLGKLSFP
jgi:anhydro-N-acetylmuramic acid kinase